VAGDGLAAVGAPTIAVEVAYAEPQHQFVEQLELPAGSVVADAIEASSVRTEFPHIEIAADRVGIFGRKVTMNEGLSAGDRVEIYRPLQADPKEVRRAKAAADAQQG
jgi:putative ubiquitin-RnfH superfamily antitoxin RatB of RatAB toxin-antitoxin module